MLKQDINSNTQLWELEVLCVNKIYLNEVINAILEHGRINFEAEMEADDKGLIKWTVFMWSVGFKNLLEISEKLNEIENKLKVCENTTIC